MHIKLNPLRISNRYGRVLTRLALAEMWTDAKMEAAHYWRYTQRMAAEDKAYTYHLAHDPDADAETRGEAQAHAPRTPKWTVWDRLHWHFTNWRPGAFLVSLVTFFTEEPDMSGVRPYG